MVFLSDILKNWKEKKGCEVKGSKVDDDTKHPFSSSHCSSSSLSLLSSSVFVPLSLFLGRKVCLWCRVIKNNHFPRSFFLLPSLSSVSVFIFCHFRSQVSLEKPFFTWTLKVAQKPSLLSGPDKRVISRWHSFFKDEREKERFSRRHKDSKESVMSGQDQRESPVSSPVSSEEARMISSIKRTDGY